MLGSVFNISSASLTRSTTMPSLSLSVASNDPVMLNTATPLLLCASITDIISIDYNATIGDVAFLF